MIKPNMTDDEKRSVLMDMTYEDLEEEITSGRLTWQEFDQLLPEIGAAIGATVMFEEAISKKDATKPIRSPLYDAPAVGRKSPYSTSDVNVYRPPQKPIEYSPPKPTTSASSEKLGLPKDEPDDSEAVKLRRVVERMLEAQEKTNDLLADILKELKRR